MNNIIDMQSDNKTKEIDVLLLIKRIWAEKLLLVKTCVIFAIVGVIVALNTPKSYTANVILAPESVDASSSVSKLGSVTSMLGLKLGSSMSLDAIYPELYPDVVASTDFLIKLFDVPVRKVDDEQSKSYYAHLTQDQKIPFWIYPRIWIAKLFAKEEKGTVKELNPFWLTKVQSEVCNAMRGKISCIIDKKTDVITISVTDNDKLVSAIMADTVRNRLQQHITNYRTKKACYDLEFMENLFEQSKTDYFEAQNQYASVTDANQALFTTTSKIKLKNLENEMQLKYEIYSSIAQQLHLAKERVQEQTPAFTIIQSATVPNYASSFPRTMLVVVYIVLGLCIDIIWILFLREFYHKFIRKND